jgi:ABC-2 type transport system permease protein
MNFRRIWATTVKEARELVRDPITVAVALLMPLVMLFLFGYAISLDVKDIRYAVWDRDNTPASRALSDAFVQSRYFAFVGAADERGMEWALKRGHIRMGLVIPEKFAARLVQREPSPVQILVDGTDSNVATIVVGYSDAIISSFRNAGLETVKPEVRVWYNPELRSANYVVPGLLAVIMMAFPPLLTALAVVREKESRSIEQIYASPLTSTEFLIGKLVPYAGVAFIEFLSVMIAGFVWFQVPFHGSIWLLSAASVIYVICTLGLGLLVSTFARTQVTAMLLALIITMMPSMVFSGFLLPIFTMPYALQLYSANFPAKYFLEISRGIVLKGAGPQQIAPNLGILVVYTITVFALAAWRMKKKVA